MPSMPRAPLSVWVLVFILSCGGTAPPGRTLAASSVVEAIDWQDLTPAVFERARAEHRLVLLDVGIEGCTACRWMYEDTYRDPAVLHLVREHFVAVAVDADARPDIGARYEPWGWPATIVLLPDGTQVLALRGNRRPRVFEPILRELIADHEARSLDVETATPPARSPAPSGLDALCSLAVARVDASVDAQHGGFGDGPRFASGEPLRWELARGSSRGEPERTAHALHTLEGLRGLIDPVWGGIFVAARRPDFSEPIVEKRTIHQGPMLAAYAEAYHRTGDPRWLESAELIERYLREWLRSPEGTYYATQEDEAPELAPGMTVADYYALPDAERRRHGVPPIDHAVYTDLDAVVIEAYVRLFEATSRAEYLDAARRAADALLDERQQPGGWMSQSAPDDRVAADDRMRAFHVAPRAYLAPQGPFGLALLALHSATGEPRWLEAARRIADGLDLLEDREHGGFRAVDVADPPLGQLVPFEDNVAAARFLVRLGWHLHDDTLDARAERTLAALGLEERLPSMGAAASSLALVLEELAYGPIEISVVGDLEDPAARALFEAGVRVWQPRKVVQLLASGERYPDQGRPAAFVCGREVCSSPIFDAAALAAAVASQSRVTESAPCAARP